MSEKDLQVGLLVHCKRRHVTLAHVSLISSQSILSLDLEYTILIYLRREGGRGFNNWISFTCVFKANILFSYANICICSFSLLYMHHSCKHCK